MDNLQKIDKPVAYDLPTDIKEGIALVLPERVNADNVALYTQESMEIFKEIRTHEDVEVTYLETQGGRKWIDRLGAGDVTVVTIIFALSTNLISNAIWAAIQKFADQRSGKKNLRVKITVANQNPDLAWTWYEFEGSAKEVSNLARRVIDEQSQKDQKA